MADETGNDLGLALSVGTSKTSNYCYRDLAGLYFDGSTSYELSDPGANGALQLTGAMTIECIAYFGEDSDMTIIGMDGPTGIEADNRLFQFEYMGLFGLPKGQLSFSWAHGAGVAVSVLSGLPVPLYTPIHIAVTRAADGKVQFYLHGKPLGELSAANTMPTGGGDGVFLIGENIVGAARLNASELLDARVYSSERSASDILAAAIAAFPQVA